MCDDPDRDLIRNRHGNGSVSCGGYLLGGTVCQPDVGAMRGGAYSLAGGFWGGSVSGAASQYVYLPIVLR